MHGLFLNGHRNPLNFNPKLSAFQQPFGRSQCTTIHSLSFDFVCPPPPIFCALFHTRMNGSPSHLWEKVKRCIFRVLATFLLPDSEFGIFCLQPISFIPQNRTISELKSLFADFRRAQQHPNSALLSHSLSHTHPASATNLSCSPRTKIFALEMDE